MARLLLNRPVIQTRSLAVHPLFLLEQSTRGEILNGTGFRFGKEIAEMGREFRIARTLNFIRLCPNWTSHSHKCDNTIVFINMYVNCITK